MASSYTNLFRFEKQANGENSTTWGTKVNTVFEMIEDAIGGYVAVAVNGGTTVLTTNNSATDQARMAIIKFTGTLLSAETVQAPATSKAYYLWNATSGAFALTIEVSGGTAVTIPQGSKVAVFTDGTDFFDLSYTAAETVAVDVASAGTIDLTTQKGDRVFVITGTTTTSAVTMNSGQFAIVIAAGAWPLTHHATTNFLNNAGSNYTLAANDMVYYSKDTDNVVRGTIIPADGTAVVAGGLTAATKAEQEAATDNTVTVTPAIQHSHPTAAKVFAKAGITGAVDASFNMTSVTDDGTGLITFTFNTDFSSADYAPLISVTGIRYYMSFKNATQAAGSIQGSCWIETLTLVDPEKWFFVAFGDQ